MICSAAVVDANLVRLEDDLCNLQAAGCDELHFDIGDGTFVPEFGLGLEIVQACKQSCSLSCCAHLMVMNPEDHIAQFIKAGCSTITVHVEAMRHGHRTINQIRDLGASPGVAINPATPLTKLDYLLDYADRVLVMIADYGYAPRLAHRNAYERVRILRENIAYRELSAKIEIGEDTSVHEAAVLSRAGAEIFNLGKSTVFKGGDIGENLNQFRAEAIRERNLV